MNKDVYRTIKLNSKDHKQMLQDLDDYIQIQLDSKQKLQDELNNYKKDEEIQKLQDEIKWIRLHSVAILSDNSHLDALNFRNEHYKSCKSNIQYIVEGTGIGDGISVRCVKCGVEKDITDYSNW